MAGSTAAAAMTADEGGGPRLAEERAQRLDRAAATVSEDASCVGSWRVDRLRAEAGADVTDAEAREALDRWGVRVAELPRLPAAPPAAIARHPGFADAVARLGRKLSIEVVFGSGIKDGFSILGGLRLDDGRRLDREAVEAALERTPPAAHQEDWNRVLSALADAAPEPGTLDDIISWEVVEVLRPLTRLGYSQRAVTEQAVRLSLKRAEAEVLAAAVAEEHQMLQSPVPAAEPRRGPGSTLPDHAAQPDPDDQPAPQPASAASGELLQPVTDLQVRSIRGRTDVVQLSWTRPPGDGIVRLRCAGERASWPPGTTVTHGDLDAYGRPLPADGLPGPGQRMSCEVALPLARTFVTAVTVGAARVVVGQAVELTRDAPVRGLSQRRFGPEVRLTWIWPDEAAYAYVAWQPSAAAAGPPGAPEARQQRSCSRRAFEAEGGFSAKMGYAAQRVEVWAVISANGEEHYTAPAEIEVPAMGTPVHYDFLPVPGVVNGIRGLAGRPRQLQLQLLAELPCVLPDLIVVRCKHPTLPLAPHHEGEIVQRIPGGPIDPGTPVRQVIPLEGGTPGWMACFADPAKTVVASAQVTLVPPPVGRQKW